MIKSVLKIAVLLLIGHALYQFLPIYLHYQQFKDDIEQTALFAGDASEEDLLQRVMDHARARRVPLAPESVAVSQTNRETVIQASYQQPIRVLPWHTYVHTFDVSTSAWHVNAR